ncbi:MAG: T9SS type A sorting domain-containing protein, partial [Bacteroidota bacterium]
FFLSLFVAISWNLVAQCPSGLVELGSQAEVDDFVATYPNCTMLNGDLFIGEAFGATDITDLSGLVGLAAIDGFLAITGNDALTSFSGMDSLTAISGSVDIVSNASLTSVEALSNLATIGDTLVIALNDALTSLTGLDALTSIGQGLTIQSNTVLMSLSGLNALTSVGGDLRISSNGALPSLSGLAALTSMGGFLQISGNSGLTSLNGLDNIGANSITGMGVFNNPRLSNCAVASICNYLSVETNNALIAGNDTGCANRGQVETACAAGPPGDVCAEAMDVNDLLGQDVGEAQLSMLQSNTENTATDSPFNGIDCHFNMDPVTNSLWFSFTGDGNTYRISTIQCAADPSSALTNTQFALYSGSCDNLIPEACNEDGDFDNDVFHAEIDQFTTVVGTEYFLLVDGFGEQTGEFCLKITRQMTVDVTELSQTNIELFPNPTTGRLQWTEVPPERVVVFTTQGQRVMDDTNPGQELNLSALPGGVYVVHLVTADQVYASRVVKQ